ncbi:uncharacterized protein LOC143433154 [Xylocopa sonorina]|uniref:uncharacterized protein LOC143433154 n=1 Tax=Xylocopa sonorina TaxID=1818115 RepID=UPI00403A9F2D
MPSITVDRIKFEIARNIMLANPEFYKSSAIDLLIGNLSDVVLRKTELGWIVAGEINGSSSQTKIQCYYTTQSTASDTNLIRFRQLEELTLKKVLSPEEQACGNNFKETIQRNSEGRYVLRLPFNNNKKNLGESRSIALRQFYFLEKRFQSDSALKERYSESNDTKNNFYFPHHAVMKKDSITTKICVVFDGSANTTSGISLNDSLVVGPTIQDDLFNI